MAHKSKTQTDETQIDEIQPHVVINGKAKKLSPKSSGKILYQIALLNDVAHIQISGNEGGGLHSKEWIALESIFALLTEQNDKAFKSSLFKSVLQGESSNNAGFLAACCRELNLCTTVDESVFLHKANPDLQKVANDLMAQIEEANADDIAAI